MEVFDHTFIPPGLNDEWAGPHHCPRCVWPYLQRVRTLDQTHWLWTSVQERLHCNLPRRVPPLSGG